MEPVTFPVSISRPYHDSLTLSPTSFFPNGPCSCLVSATTDSEPWTPTLCARRFPLFSRPISRLTGPEIPTVSQTKKYGTPQDGVTEYDRGLGTTSGPITDPLIPGGCGGYTSLQQPDRYDATGTSFVPIRLSLRSVPPLDRLLERAP